MPERDTAPGRALRDQTDVGGAGGDATGRDRLITTPTSAASSSAVGMPRVILKSGASSMPPSLRRYAGKPD
jgi:hypothetical protein